MLEHWRLKFMIPHRKVWFDLPCYTRSSLKKKGKVPEEKARLSFKWDDCKKELFFQLCIEQVNSGKRVGASLKPEAFKKVSSEIGKAFDEERTYAEVKNFWNSQKKLWSAMNSLLNATGLGLDSLTKCVAGDHLWWKQGAQVNIQV